METYPASLASHAHDAAPEAGAITPTHGGMVPGHEFDIPIVSPNAHHNTPPSPPSTSAAHTQPTPSTPQATNGTLLAPANTGATPRRAASATSSRPRPVSMPPPSYATSPDERTQRHPQDTPRTAQRTDGSSSNRARGSSRILGDYTLSKTLGAGSMGKVKLAHHNVTGEKVRPTRLCCEVGMC